VTVYVDQFPGSGRLAASPTQRQHRAMHALWREAGITDRAARLALTAAAIRRHIASSAELTHAEADALLVYMRALKRAGTLADTAAAFLAAHPAGPRPDRTDTEAAR
jgi:hypothetical protein